MIQRSIYQKRIGAFIDKPVIKVITGIRRSGKSSLMKLIINEILSKGITEKQILYINKDSVEFDDIRDYLDLHRFVKSYFKNVAKSKYLFIDEVQEIKGWEKAVSGFLNDRMADVYITGSNSRMLSSELATMLTGRYVEFPLYTLTFSEFLEFRKHDGGVNIENEFEMYLRYGGFPGIHELTWDEDVIYQYLESVYHTLLLKDVVVRHSIRDVALLENIVHYSASNIGNITSAKNISDFIKSQHLKGTVDTVQNYLKHLCEAFIFHQCRRYDIPGKRVLEINEKYFAADLGLKHCILSYRKQDIGGHLENLVYLELLSRGYKVAVGKNKEKEIDFIATRKEEKKYIQVAYLLTEKETVDREFGSMKTIDDNYPCIVLSMDKIFDTDRNGIKWQYLPDYLLNKD